MRNHGDPHYTNKAQRLKTMNEKYGINYSGESQELLDKSRKTHFNKTGYFSALENPNIRKNFKYIILSRYGTYNTTGQYIYNFIKFDSKPELAIWIYCIDHNIPIMRNPRRFIYNYDNKDHYYEPDFLINNELVEIKGDQFLDKTTGKWICPYTKLHHNFEEFTEEEKA